MINADSPDPIEVFYCYEQKDEALCNELEKHLGALKRLHVIKNWHPRDIQPGTDWEQEIYAHLDIAHLILLFISSDFIDSDYCHKAQKRALERQKQGKAKVIPILLRYVNLEETPIASLSILPTGGKPITSWSDRDAAFADVSKSIQEVIHGLKSDRSMPHSVSSEYTMTETVDQEGYSRRPRPSYYQTIDTEEVVSRFLHFMQPDSNIRVLRLIGETKMGKSHLLAKVIPSLVEQNDKTRYAILDLRNRMYVVPDILDMACSLLGLEYFAFYSDASRDWRGRLQRDPRRGQSNQGSRQSISEFTQNRDRDLTLQFAKDLSRLDDKILLFLLDSVSNAHEYMQSWLANTFLPYVSQTAHVRSVVAGRSLPDVHSSYALYCEDYQLQAIKNVNDYVDYCRELNTLLGEQSIRDFAYACDYIPGMFAELVYPKFIKGKGIL